MIEVNIYHPTELSRGQWGGYQALYRDGLNGNMDRSLEEINYLIDWNNPINFYNSHIDPNAAVSQIPGDGRRLYANQVFDSPKVAVAIDDGELVGAAYSVYNASGGGSPEGPHNNSKVARTIRALKLLSVVKNHLVIREVVTRPDYQHKGVVKQTVGALLADAIPWQPVNLYVWPEEKNIDLNKLEKLHFKETGRSWETPVLSSDSKKLKVVSLEAPSAKQVYETLTGNELEVSWRSLQLQILNQQSQILHRKLYAYQEAQGAISPASDGNIARIEVARLKSRIAFVDGRLNTMRIKLVSA